MILEFIGRNEEAIIASFVASLLFTFFLFSLRPRISISENIAKFYSKKDKKDLFLIKIKNRSLLFKLYDVRAKLYVVEYIPTNNTALNTVSKEIGLIRDSFWVLSSFYFWHVWQWINPTMRLKKRTDYCGIFATELDIEEILDDDKHILIEIYARHPLSGFARVCSMLYQHNTNVKEGHFLSGNTFRIV